MMLGQRLAGRILEHLVSQTADQRYRDHAGIIPETEAG